MNSKYIEIYNLLDYDGADGADGRSNSSSGLMTYDQSVATQWCKLQSGANYNAYKGILINSITEVKDARVEVERVKALSKLSDREKKLLGLV